MGRFIPSRSDAPRRTYHGRSAPQLEHMYKIQGNTPAGRWSVRGGSHAERGNQGGQSVGTRGERGNQGSGEAKVGVPSFQRSALERSSGAPRHAFHQSIRTSRIPPLTRVIACTGIAPVKRIIHIPPSHRIVMHVPQPLSHHFPALNRHGMAPPPARIDRICPVCESIWHPSAA